MNSLKSNKYKKAEFTVLTDLFITISILSENIRLYKKGSVFHVRTIYGLLRSLLTDNSKGSKALLAQVTEFVEFDFYIDYLNWNLEDLPIEPHIAIGINIVNDDRSEVKPTRTGILDILSLEVLIYDKRKVRLRELINDCANNIGGAHVSSYKVKYLEDLTKMEIFGDSLINQILLPLGDTLVKRCTRFFYELTSFDLEIGFHLGNQGSIEKINFFDVYKEGTGQRLIFTRTGSEYTLIISDEIGHQNTIKFQGDPTAMGVNRVRLNLKLLEDLTSQIKVTYNRKVLKDEVLGHAIFFYSDIKQLMLSLNTIKGQKSNISKNNWGLLWFITTSYDSLSLDEHYQELIKVQRKQIPILGGENFVVSHLGKDKPFGSFGYMNFDFETENLSKIV